MHRFAAISAIILTTPALANPADALFDWITVGDPGNAPAVLGDGTLPTDTGTVNYTYRLTRTPVTAERYFDFVQAYRPYLPNDYVDFGFSGVHIRINNSDPDNVVYELRDHVRQHPTTASLEWAARYMNWLHNGMSNEREAFESGVYDTSTFYYDDQGRPQHDFTRSADARYWIPTLDEMLKAAHYDPDKNNGEGGWWQFANRSDTPLAIARPEDGGEQIGDLVSLYNWQVGQYPETASAYGLLDFQGTVYQWAIEDQFNSLFGVGSYAGEDPVQSMWDGSLIAGQLPLHQDWTYAGFRIAATVPAPASLALFAATPYFLRRTRPPAARAFPAP